jgi:hypothetical protein
MSACPVYSVLVQLVGDKWVPRRDANVHDLEVSPWLAGSSLAAVVPRRSGPPWGYELMVLEKNRTPPVAERAGAARDASCHTRLSEVAALEAFRTGEIFVFGTECPLLPAEEPNEPGDAAADAAPAPSDEWSSPVVVESFAPGARRSTFTTLPLRELSSTFGVAGDDIWAAGRASESEWRLVHYDGKSWNLLPERFEQPLGSVFVPSGETGPGARRFFIAGTKVLEFSQGTTHEHAVPDNCAPLNVQLQDEQLWLLCSLGDYELAVFTTDTKVSPFHFSDDPDRPRVTWNESSYPPLDPKAPPGGCGGPRQFESTKPAPHSKPSPLPRPKTKAQSLDVLDFGY